MRLVAIFFVAGLVAQAQEAVSVKDAVAAIRRVTVYPDRALVTRGARFDLPKGVSSLLFNDLPPGIIDDTIRAKITGSDKVRLRGVEIQSYAIERPQGEQRLKLQERIDQARDKIAEVADRETALRAEREFILSLKAAASRDAAERVGKEKASVEDWAKIAVFIEESLLKISEKERKALRDRRELEAGQRVLAAELAHLTAGAGLVRKKVLVTAAADEAAGVTIEFSYGILGAGWVPSYDLHADTERGEVTLTYFGQILQSTGEDWNNVEVSLSTADPAKSASMPALTPLLLGSPQDEFHTAEATQEKQLWGNYLQRRVQDLDHIVKCQNLAVMGKLAPNQRVVAAAAARAHLATHLFRIPNPETAPSDQSPHKMIIAVTKFGCAFERVCTPSLTPHVFIKTVVLNTNDFPYMPGDLNLFRENHYIGASSIEMVAPRERFDVFVGVDEGIKAVRKLESKRVEAGALNKVHYTFTIKVENFKAKKTIVKVVDRVPVSRDSDIDVFIELETTKPTSQDADGKLTWTVELEPGQSRDLRLAYRIFHPANKPVPQIE